MWPLYVEYTMHLPEVDTHAGYACCVNTCPVPNEKQVGATFSRSCSLKAWYFLRTLVIKALVTVIFYMEVMKNGFCNRSAARSSLMYQEYPDIAVSVRFHWQPPFSALTYSNIHIQDFFVQECNLLRLAVCSTCTTTTVALLAPHTHPR